MGTLQEQQRKFDESVAYIENLRTSQGPYDLNKQLELNRKLNALLNQAAHGAFRHAPPESKSALGTREKQQWESLGNISRVEAMRQFTVKAQEIKAEAELLERTHGGQ
ncbi:hypothetical protein HA402_003842 [Bradysia odoriphaga]|uniref:uncharacterized protein LOC119067771 n=1 Tax=Bradysia coprophila TaxID=38358 RepID=UPI00187D9A1F|nr:uncharacterized protein LOC119067771 [Bradysia coprophila]KAG4076016.1 hypothetical protein HA402_003842 [Bradysia odoriphaga]